MIRLVFADALLNWRIWVGAFVVAVAATAAGAVPATLLRTAIDTGGRASLGLDAIAGTVIAFTTVAVVVVVNGIMRATVGLQLRSYALWRIAGVTPNAVRRVVSGQLAIVSAAGALVGAGVAAAAPAFVEVQLRQASGLDGVRPAVTAFDQTVVALVVVAVSVAAGFRATAAAASTPAVTVLRDAGGTRPPRRTLRVLGALALVALAVQMVVSLPSSLSAGAPAAVLIGPVLIAALSAVAPFVAPALMTAWTALVPARMSASFVVARALVLHATDRSVTTVSALIVAIGLPVTLDAGRRTVATALGGQPTDGTGALALVLGGPVLLAAVGAAAAAFMASRTRGRDQALLRAAGATEGFTIRVAVSEAVVHVVNAAIIAVLLTLVTVIAEAAAFTAAGVPASPVLPVGTLVAAIAATAPPMVVATLVPALLSERRSLRERLAAADA
ncbi:MULTISPECIES: hypothetical protein [unclassified Curtobacterium]|uniref:hypothetical protein n=1 Tax=unclassified Curtobacterium TaxID=257496 RepID=UPI000DAA8082|nr:MULTISPECIES: hypothetical protein [unclassified Curtobacterium]PZF44639.1 hypothetical protein DEJ07_00780 [Curtobacterium sp. MCLR17_053]PZF52720.1 hypothetical protein DEJ06_06090 [Curtobacterium sp. MCLR17_051]